MSINQDRASVEAYAQWLLRLLDLKKVSKARRINAQTSLERLDAHRVPLDHFKDAIPFDSEAALNWRGAEHGDQPADVFTIATPADVDNRLNVATVQRCNDPGQEDDGRMLLRRVRLVKRPLFPVPRAARHVVELATLAVTDEDRGVAETRVSYFGSDGTPGDLFTNLVSGEPDAQATLMLRIAFGLQFMRHYDWHVRVQGPKGTGLLIPATAAGCRNLLKERDLTEGEVRRASLVHLVAEHQRRRPSAPTGSTDPADLAWVREHSRGRRQFTWNGMVGEVLPAQDVLDRIAPKP